MNLLEHQAKSLLSEYSLPTPGGTVARTAAEARAAFDALDSAFCVVKAQVQAGQRATGGGVHRATNAIAAEVIADDMLGSRLVTPETPSAGLPVNAVLVECGCQAVRELYLALLLSPATGRLMALAAPVGGTVVRDTELPDRLRASEQDVAHVPLPMDGNVDPATIGNLASALDLEKDQLDAFGKLLVGLVRVFIERDATLLEINPLAVTDDGEFCCLDVKLTIDANAAFRQPWIESMRETSHMQARRRDDGFNLEPLDGNVGCIVTGAGLALATMDLLTAHDLAPANFLDLPPGAKVEEIANAIGHIVAEPRVDRLLLHAVAGGFTSCDRIAAGMVHAADTTRAASLPLAVRFAGFGRDDAHDLLRKAGLSFTSVASLGEIPAAVAGLAADNRVGL